jgi:hypothetical protein
MSSSPSLLNDLGNSPLWILMRKLEIMKPVARIFAAFVSLGVLQTAHADSSASVVLDWAQFTVSGPGVIYKLDPLSTSTYGAIRARADDGNLLFDKYGDTIGHITTVKAETPSGLAVSTSSLTFANDLNPTFSNSAYAKLSNVFPGFTTAGAVGSWNFDTLLIRSGGTATISVPYTISADLSGLGDSVASATVKLYVTSFNNVRVNESFTGSEYNSFDSVSAMSMYGLPGGTHTGILSLSFSNPTDSVVSYEFQIYGGSLASVQAVPEPETYGLMLAGLAVLGGARRSRRCARTSGLRAPTSC